MQITIPDDLQIQNHAITAGFASVEKYIQHLVEEDLVLEKKSQSVRKISRDKWQKKFQSLLELVEPGNPNADYSRESIYAERMAQLSLRSSKSTIDD